jgi:ribulose-5-phosphate 4-epimerase/fuculose-1-phosphate aldolase
MAIDPRSFPRPQAPSFSTPSEAREQAKRASAAAFRIFWKLGFDEGVMGHISFRDPEFADQFWINPFAVCFGQIRAADLMRISLEGKVLEGDGFPHPGGIPQHASIYAENPEIRAVAHTHSPHGKAWSTLGQLLEPLSTEAAVFFGRHALYDSFAHGEGGALGRAARGNRAVIMKNHGILTVGTSVEETAYLFISLEKVCREQLLAFAAGEPRRIPTEHAERIAQFFGASQGWLNFQPAYQDIVRDQPDLLN